MALIVDAVLLVTFVAMAIQSVGYLREPFWTSPGILPLVVSTAAALTAACVLMAELSRPDGRVPRLSRWISAPRRRLFVARTAGWIALTLAYAFGTPTIGYVPATFLFLALSLHFYARLSWWRILCAAAVVTAVLPFTFRYVFHSIIP